MPPRRRGDCAGDGSDRGASALEEAKNIVSCRDVTMLQQQLRQQWEEHHAQLELARQSCPCRRAIGRQANAIATESKVRETNTPFVVCTPCSLLHLEVHMARQSGACALQCPHPLSGLCNASLNAHQWQLELVPRYQAS